MYYIRFVYTLFYLQILFDDSSDNEDGKEEDYDKMFAIKPQFEGEKGAKVIIEKEKFHCCWNLRPLIAFRILHAFNVLHLN